MLMILTACSGLKRNAVLPEFLATPAGFIDASYPTAQVEVDSPAQTSNGIQMDVQRAWQDGKNLNAEVCFTLPDASDWSIWNASLNHSGGLLQEYGTTFISLKESAEGQQGVRCDLLTFVVAPDADLSSASIVIEAIAAYPREGDYCSMFMPKIQQALSERGIGITLDCLETDGAAVMQITGRPADMTQEQAEQIVFSDEFYTLKGPWTFNIHLQ
jgi:hypothetical protein